MGAGGSRELTQWSCIITELTDRGRTTFGWRQYVSDDAQAASKTRAESHTPIMSKAKYERARKAPSMNK